VSRRPKRGAGAAHAFLGAAAAVAACVLIAGAAAADWLQPDPTYREQQFLLRMAMRDTVGHPDDPGRLDSLGTVLLRLDRTDEAKRVFERILELRPGDDRAEAALGKLALFEDRLDDAERLLSAAAATDGGARTDLFAARIRRGAYAAAAEMAADVNQEGRRAMLERMAGAEVYRIAAGPAEEEIMWASAYPVPLVRVLINGQRVLMAIDTGADDIMLDESAARRYKVTQVPGQRLTFWSGGRTVVSNAMLQRLEIGHFKLENLPAGVLSLRRWSIEVNTYRQPVVGIIGLNFLRRFTPTLDYKRQRLVLRRPDTPFTPTDVAQRVPFQLWGEAEMMVHGTLGTDRRMAFAVQSGVPRCGVAAPAEVFEEIGVKAGVVSRMVKGAGSWLRGRPWSEVSVPAVTVGPIVEDNVPGWLGAFEASEMWRYGVRRDGLISHDFLRGWRLTIDWRDHQLIFE